MLFFTLSNMNIKFTENELIWKTYNAVEALPTIGKIEFINKKDFPQALLDKDLETFVVYVSFLGLSLMTIFLKRKARMALLLTKEIIILKG